MVCEDGPRPWCHKSPPFFFHLLRLLVTVFWQVSVVATTGETLIRIIEKDLAWFAHIGMAVTFWQALRGEARTKRRQPCCAAVGELF